MEKIAHCAMLVAWSPMRSKYFAAISKSVACLAVIRIFGGWPRSARSSPCRNRSSTTSSRSMTQLRLLLRRCWAKASRLFDEHDARLRRHLAQMVASAERRQIFQHQLDFGDIRRVVADALHVRRHPDAPPKPSAGRPATGCWDKQQGVALLLDVRGSAGQSASS